MPAGGAATFYLDGTCLARPGIHSAHLSSDRRVAAIARTDWTRTGGAAIYSDVEPGLDVILPLVVAHDAQSSIISIQNTDAQESAEVEVRFQSQHTAGRLTTGIQVMNLGQQTAIATIHFAGYDGSVLSYCPKCSATIEPLESHTWYPPAIHRPYPNTYGSALIESDQPLAVIVNDFSERDRVDSAIYNGIEAD